MLRTPGLSATLVLLVAVSPGCDDEKPFCDAHGDGTACDDGDPCTTGEACLAGACGPGAPVDCSVLDDACHAGACDPLDGTCRAGLRVDGTACDDGDPCTTGEACLAGACGDAAPVDCSALDDACNTGTCDPLDGTCRASPLADGSTCDDGVSCTTGDQCLSGACAGEPPDADGDGSAAAGCLDGDDCDDERAEVNPGATEGPAGDATCGDTLDNDCDGTTDASDSSCSTTSEICPRTTMPAGISELRLRDLTVTAPAALTNVIIAQLINDSLERDLFVWLLRFGGLGSGAATLETGAGQLAAGASCTYSYLGTPYDPATTALTETGSDFALSGAPIERLDVPMWAEGEAFPDPPLLILPLSELDLSGTISADRLLIGSYDTLSESWTDGGTIQAKITVSEARATIIDVLGMTLCGLLSGETGTPGNPSDDCEGDSTTWSRPPDTTVGTEPAYAMTATFAASAVYVEP